MLSFLTAKTYYYYYIRWMEKNCIFLFECSLSDQNEFTHFRK